MSELIQQMSSCTFSISTLAHWPFFLPPQKSQQLKNFCKIEEFIFSNFLMRCFKMCIKIVDGKTATVCKSFLQLHTKGSKIKCHLFHYCANQCNLVGYLPEPSAYLMI